MVPTRCGSWIAAEELANRVVGLESTSLAASCGVSPRFRHRLHDPLVASAQLAQTPQVAVGDGWENGPGVAGCSRDAPAVHKDGSCRYCGVVAWSRELRRSPPMAQDIVTTAWIDRYNSSTSARLPSTSGHDGRSLPIICGPGVCPPKARWNLIRTRVVIATPRGRQRGLVAIRIARFRTDRHQRIVGPCAGVRGACPRGTSRLGAAPGGTSDCSR
jgi:hypothetical protein